LRFLREYDRLHDGPVRDFFVFFRDLPGSHDGLKLLIRYLPERNDLVLCLWHLPVRYHFCLLERINLLVRTVLGHNLKLLDGYLPIGNYFQLLKWDLPFSVDF